MTYSQMEQEMVDNYTRIQILEQRRPAPHTMAERLLRSRIHLHLLVQEELRTAEYRKIDEKHTLMYGNQKIEVPLLLDLDNDDEDEDNYEDDNDEDDNDEGDDDDDDDEGDEEDDNDVPLTKEQELDLDELKKKIREYNENKHGHANDYKFVMEELKKNHEKEQKDIRFWNKVCSDIELEDKLKEKKKEEELLAKCKEIDEFLKRKGL